MFIQLQYYNELGNNAGGLYLNTANIASIRSCEMKCKILMVDGTEYTIVNSIAEVLDMLNKSILEKTKV